MSAVKDLDPVLVKLAAAVAAFPEGPEAPPTRAQQALARLRSLGIKRKSRQARSRGD